MKIDAQILNNKLELIQWLSTLEDSSILERLMEFRRKESKDWWDSVSNEEQESIEKGIEQADENDLEPHSNARKRYERWL